MTKRNEEAVLAGASTLETEAGVGVMQSQAGKAAIYRSDMLIKEYTEDCQEGPSKTFSK